MEEFGKLLDILKDYDLPTIVLGIVVYLQVKKKLEVVDKAVNQRSPGQMTLSEEVSEIHRKVDIANVQQEYLVKEIDAHRSLDEKEFVRIGKDIRDINRRLTEIAK